MSVKMRNNLVVTILMLICVSVAPASENSSDMRTNTLASNEPGAPRHYEILFMGNSHSSSNDLPGLVSTLIKAGSEHSTAGSDLAPGWGFLVDRLNDGATLQSFNSRPWTHVVLQAQKYSTTGRYTYPTDAAEEWIRRVKAKNALPILFPEWPREGNTEEGPRVHQLHIDIAAREPACVAPIGLAWEEAIARYPQLKLHAVDGNHSSLTGALLTAYVLYHVITLQDASLLPHIPEIRVAPQVQKDLREIAAIVVRQNEAECIGPRIELNPDEIEFNVLASDEFDTQTFTLRSTGNLPATIKSITEPDEPFFLDRGTCDEVPLILSPTESCALLVRFEPRFEGLFLDQISLEADHPNPPLNIDLSGFNGVVVPTLSRFGVFILIVLVIGSGAMLKRWSI